ncbi:hypothetical protein GBAR_LOCUS13688, partial [Geodia barretti]
MDELDRLCSYSKLQFPVSLMDCATLHLALWRVMQPQCRFHTSHWSRSDE